ncbi:MAG: hypothetical protein A3F13_00645 [Gammaproteobacteria bacterium RIFCSPHIGHO2_12_FULL_40_19]|nr:MAG: hypothetical protein A3F13_00645 [Gammaproteobacteria bacterium RIFCSPHIGHO2_12_FULL_40_19]
MATKRISDEERQLFRDAVSNVKPLKQTSQPKIRTKDPKITASVEKKSIKQICIRSAEPFDEKITFQFTEKQSEITGEDVIGFSRPGLQHKRFAQLRQGKTRIEATLDLHQHTTDEAIHATDIFLKQSHKNHLRLVCIIHGKGHYSADNKPVIKNLLNHFLRQHPLVLAFHSSKNKHGGTGAIYVLIKSK